MTLPDGPLADLRPLLDALCEGVITPEQMRRLEELINGHPEAEAYYVQYMSLFAQLSRQFAAPPVTAEQSLRGRIARHDPPRRRRRLAAWGGLGLVGLAAGVLAVVLLGPPRPPDVVTPPNPDVAAVEPVDSSVAVLVQAHGAVWDEGDLPTRTGAPLSPGWLRLKSGFAQIEFYCGATVVLQGPAELQIVSRSEAFCARGKLRASVPPQAHGFAIGTPKLDLVDRGTEFGVQVDGADRAEVHVFQGQVDLYDPGAGHDGAPRQELKTGRGVVVEGPGRLSPIALNPAAFESAQALAERWEAEARVRHRKWLDASARWRKDPGLLVYYTFQPKNTWARTVPDEADVNPRPHDGAIIGCTWGVGRWPGKGGLEFKQVSDRVRLHVDGEYDSLTLAAWVRVDALPNRFNALFLTDHWDDGAPHWHLSDTGKVELGVQGPNQKGGVHYFGPEVITPGRLGQWVHLAVVHDHDRGVVTHYLDGRPVSQEPIKLDVRLRIGDAEVGNWNVDGRKHKSPVRYFNGCVDEFMLFSRPLGDEEVQELYTQGQPPS